jgi:pimeloyl-ACP methyl ester carboxylesterase
MSSTPTNSSPDTVVLLHGLWMTPRSWEKWVPYYEAKGFTVLTPGYPGFEIEVEALRENPELIARLTVPDVVEHLARVVESVEVPPVVIGHQVGGGLTQLLLARGLGSAGVAIDSAPPGGVRVTTWSQARSLYPVLRRLSNRDAAVSLTPDEFHHAFTNTSDDRESRQVWERYAIPAPARWIFGHGLVAGLGPGPQQTWVGYAADRAPLLFVAGERDHIMPPSVNRANARRYRRSPAVTEYRELAGRDHWTCGSYGWEQVADLALGWALEHARTDRPWVAA